MPIDIPPWDPATGSELLTFADGLIGVYADGEGGVLLTVRQKPNDVFRMRSVTMTGEQARQIGQALLDASMTDIVLGVAAERIEAGQAVCIDRATGEVRLATPLEGYAGTAVEAIAKGETMVGDPAVGRWRKKRESEQ